MLTPSRVEASRFVRGTEQEYRGRWSWPRGRDFSLEPEGHRSASAL